MKSIYLILFIFCSVAVVGQKGKTSFGIQFKPIIPNKFIGQLEQEFIHIPIPQYNGLVTQKLGYAFGMVIRQGISKTISIESGINFVQRNFNFSFNTLDSGIVTNKDFAFVNYDIPINALIYIKLSNKWYMNASGGISLSFYPSSIKAFADIKSFNNTYSIIGERTKWANLGLNANYGFEYRTKKSGALYLGASFSSPFSSAMSFYLTWENNSTKYRVSQEFKGSYLTLDLKYFLP